MRVDEGGQGCIGGIVESGGSGGSGGLGGIICVHFCSLIFPAINELNIFFVTN